ncbi:hypothetical protein PWT90_08315 [Aphanocladium album]|nr:hypothetical protein PWT90_08315 [Aphanocladium album]
MLRNIDIKDLPALHPSMTTEYLSEQHLRQNSPGSPSLSIALAKSYAVPLLLQWALSILQSFVILAPHTITYHLLEWLSGEFENPGQYGIGIALLLGATVIVDVLVDSWLKWVNISMIKLPMEATLNSLIYRKALRLPNATQDSAGKHPGQSIMAQMTAYSNSHLLLMTLTKLASTTALLVKLVGWTGLILGTLASMLVGPLTTFVSGKYNAAVRNQANFQQQRQATLSEALLAIRQIKIAASEDIWKNRIAQLRREELHQLLIGGLWMAIMVFAANISPSILSGVPIYISNLQGNQHSAAVAFTSIGLFTQLQSSLAMLPITTPPIWAALDYLGRIEAFLATEELNSGRTTASVACALDSAVVTWHGSQKTLFTLKNLSLSFPQGELSIVTGSTGSGKSLLLAALAGEAKLVSGNIYLPRVEGGGRASANIWVVPGQTAMVSQTPWMNATSIKENIIFGLPLKQGRYDAVLHCCALDKDLVNLPDGDATNVGIKGVALSGGQRWRISLARALYSRASFIILDDVLSAVDAEVRQWIVEEAVLGDLAAGRTRVLVTHHASQCANKAAQQINVSNETAKTLSQMSSASHSSKDEKKEPNDVGKAHVGATKTVNRGAVGEKRRPADPQARENYSLYIKATGGRSIWLVALLATGICAAIDLRTSWQLRDWASLTNQLQSAHLSQGTMYILLATLRCLTMAVKCFVWYMVGMNASRRLFDGMMSAVFGAPLQWLEGTSNGDILNRSGSEMSTVDGRLPHDASFMIESIAGLCCVLLTNLSSSFYNILLIITICYLYGKLGTKLISATRLLKPLTLQASSSLQQHVSALQAPDGIMTVRVYGMSDQFIQTVHGLIDNRMVAMWHSAICDTMTDVHLGAVGALFVTVTSLSLVYTRADAGTAGVALSFAMKFGKTMTRLLQRVNVVEAGLQSVKRIDEYGHLQQEVTSQIEVPESWPSRGRIRFKGFTAGYYSESPAVLGNLTFTVEPGERVGVVGRTGAGKSTLTLALMMLIEVRDGSILIDDIDISTVKLSTLRRKIFVIPQDPYLFRGTLRAVLDPDGTCRDDELLGALSRVQWDAHTAHVGPQLADLSFLVEDGGRNLSQGQRQILYLAKALLTRKRIIVMDEATSAVDVETDLMMQTALRQGLSDTTVLVVAHRLATIADFDKVLVMDRGKVIEIGAPMDLYSKKGIFWKLVQHSSDKIPFSIVMAEPSLAQLPNDLVLVLADVLTEASMNALTQTCRRFHDALAHALYVRNARERNSSALQWAAAEGHMSTLKKALAAGGDPNAKRPDHDNFHPGNHTYRYYDSAPLRDVPFTTPIASAAKIGRLDIASVLIEAGALVYVEPQGRLDMAPIMVAMEDDNLEMMKLFLSAGKIDVDNYIYFNRRLNLLSLAVTSGADEIARYLLAKMRNPDASCSRFSTPILAAAQGPTSNILPVLLNSKGLDPNKTDGDGRTPLMLAAQSPSQNEAPVRFLLDSPKVNINAIDNNGQTAISLAAEAGNTEIVRMLLSMPNIDPNLADSDGLQPVAHALRRGKMPLMYMLMASDKVKFDAGVLFRIACEYASSDVIKRLLARDTSEWTSTDRNGSSWLHTAATYGRTDNVKIILNKKQADINQQRLDGATPLVCAVRARRRATTTVLLRAGADVNLATRDGRSPLFYSTESSSEALTQELLKRGAKVDAVTNTGETALHRACRTGGLKVIQLLLDHGADPVLRAHDGRTPLHEACSARWEQTVQLLLSYIPPSHPILTTGRTPLHDSCRAGHTGISKQLVEHGADPLARLDDGSTPLEYACNGFPLIAKMLLEKGADPHQRNSAGVRLLYQACTRSTPKVAALLLQHGADPNAVEIGGNTPFLEACRQGGEALIRTLLKYGGDVMSTKPDGTTCLHELCHSSLVVDQTTVMRLMIDKGADVNARTEQGLTPLHVACRHYGTRTIPLLVAAGADTLAEYVDPSTERRLTPIHMACRFPPKTENVGTLLGLMDSPLADVWASGWTPLHEAATATDPEGVDLLLKHGLNPMALAENGRTPLHQLFDTTRNLIQLPHEPGAREIFFSLMATGKMDINHRDNDGKTALGLAADAPRDLRVAMIQHGAKE